MFFKDKGGNAISIQDNGLILITPIGDSTVTVTLQEIISKMELRLHNSSSLEKFGDFRYEPGKGTWMTIGTARWIFGNIDQEPYTDDEKIEAISIVVKMETHNAIKKDEMVAAMKWLLNHRS